MGLGLEAQGESADPIAPSTIHHILLILLCYYILYNTGISVYGLGRWTGLNLGTCHFLHAFERDRNEQKGSEVEKNNHQKSQTGLRSLARRKKEKSS